MHWILSDKQVGDGATMNFNEINWHHGLNLADVLDRVMREKCKGMFTACRDVMCVQKISISSFSIWLYIYISKIEYCTVYTVYFCLNVYTYTCIYDICISVYGLYNTYFMSSDSVLSQRGAPRPCKGTHGIVAVFVRSMELGHVLHALGGGS